MHPRDYPWAVPARTGVVGPAGLVPRLLPSLAGRTPVLAIGSNASPEVLVGKLGGVMHSGLPVAPALVDGLLVGHSAHVSTRGYLAAAPAPRAGVVAAITLTWCDADQVDQLDASEPNYRRLPLPGSMCRRLGDAGTVPGVQLYVSAHGLLADDGEVLPLRPQAQVLAWLAHRLPGLGGDLDHEHLRDPGVRERVRAGLIASDLRADPWPVATKVDE